MFYHYPVPHDLTAHRQVKKDPAVRKCTDSHLGFALECRNASYFARGILFSGKEKTWKEKVNN